jgi:capsid protein
MIVNLGSDGSLETFSPNQPNINPEAFVQHMLRGVSAGFPGLKASTVIGDYRRSSFSSEKSADNDVWPEIMAIQEWFAAGFCQPIYEAVLRSAILAGYFDGIVSAEEFQANRQQLVVAKWQGPVSQSINPEKDVAAAASRIKSGLSSPQMECAKLNVNWRDVIADNAEFYMAAAEAGLPEEVINGVFSIEQTETAEEPEPAQTVEAE